MIEKPKFRIYSWKNKQMYHHIRGYLDNLYVVFSNEGQKHKNLGPKETMIELEIDGDTATYMPFVGSYDHTAWDELSKEDKEFWGLKGYTDINWKGKEIYYGDIIEEEIIGADGKVVESRKYVVMTFDDVNTRKNVRTYVKGNIQQNHHLLK